MKTVILDVRSLDDATGAFAQAWRVAEPSGPDRISFATPELLWQVLTARRWALIKLLCGAGPLSMREVARRAGRDVKAVHTDLTALLNAGLVRRHAAGVVFPYEAVKVEFLLHAA